MYRTIYVPVDNSDYSNASVDLAVALSKKLRADLVGSHVYAAKLHDVRFKQMEFTLPDEYKEDTELEKQRKIHDALIARGLHLISDSYLDQMAESANEAGLGFVRKHFDGKNFEALVTDVNDSDYDLVILGALGQGAVKDSLVGSVVERLLRRTEVDTIVVRDLEPLELEADDRITVCHDGSAYSYSALKKACTLAAQLSRPLEIVAATTTEDEALLAAHLEVAARYAREQGIDVSTRTVVGPTREAVTELARKDPPWLLVLGRSGIDANGEAMIGATTERVVRHAKCNVLVSSGQVAPTELSVSA